MNIQLELFAKAVKCQHYGHHTYNPFYAVRHAGKATIQFAFCNEEHANEYYLERLRRVEVNYASL